MTKSYTPEVIADSTGKWCGNGLNFATKQEAEQYVYDLSCHWTLVTDIRAVESNDPVSYTYHDCKLRPVVDDAQ